MCPSAAGGDSPGGGECSKTRSWQASSKSPAKHLPVAQPAQAGVSPSAALSLLLLLTEM